MGNKTCLLDFTIPEDSLLQVSFNEKWIIKRMKDQLEKLLERKGYRLLAEHREPEADEFIIRGAFTQISEGNQFLRLLFPILGGRGRLDVEGNISMGIKVLDKFHFTKSHSWFGSGQSVLEVCVFDIAYKIFKRFQKVTRSTLGNYRIGLVR